MAQGNYLKQFLILKLLLCVLINGLNTCFITIADKANQTYNFTICNNTIAENTFDKYNYTNFILITGCHIKTLPAQLLKNLTNLVNITLAGNKLAHLPEGFFAANPNLINADLSRNDFTHIPPLKSASIKTLDLSENKIDKMNESYALKGLLKLQALNLTWNRLAMLTGVVSSKSLQDLDLSHNRIQRIRVDSLYGFPALKTLRLDENKLVYIPERNIFSRTINLSSIYLGNNPYNFDCGNTEFLESWIYLNGPDQKLKDGDKVKFSNRLLTAVLFDCRKKIDCFLKDCQEETLFWRWILYCIAVLIFVGCVVYGLAKYWREMKSFASKYLSPAFIAACNTSISTTSKMNVGEENVKSTLLGDQTERDHFSKSEAAVV